MPPKYKVCYICGREYGSQSLVIHQKQCMAKREKEQAMLPPHLRTPLIPQEQAASMDNDQAFDHWKKNLSACPNCGRTFLPDRLAVHQRSCTSDSPAKRASGSISSPISNGGDGDDGYSYGNAYAYAGKPSSTASVKQPPADTGKPAAPAARRMSADYGKGPAVRPDASRTSSSTSLRQPDMGRTTSAAPPSMSRPPSNSRLSADMGRRDPSAQGFGSGYGGAAGYGTESAFGSGYDPVPTSQMGRMNMNGASKPSQPAQPPTLASRRPASTAFASSPVSTPGSSFASAPAFSAPAAAPKQSAARPASKALGPSGRGAPFAGPQVNTVACRVCGRSFNEDRIEKHESICKDVSGHQRKKFDSSKARKKGTELEGFKTKPTGASSRGKAVGGAKSQKWRQQHEEFMQAVKQSRMIKKIQEEGGDLSLLPPPPPSENPDYVQCPHCMRRFNETAAERHIPKCKTTIHKPKPPPSSSYSTSSAKQLPPKTSSSTTLRAPAKPAAQQRTSSSTSLQPSATSSAYPSSTSAYGDYGYGASENGYSSKATATRAPTSSASGYSSAAYGNSAASMYSNTNYNNANYSSTAAYYNPPSTTKPATSATSSAYTLPFSTKPTTSATSSAYTLPSSAKPTTSAATGYNPNYYPTSSSTTDYDEYDLNYSSYPVSTSAKSAAMSKSGTAAAKPAAAASRAAPTRATPQASAGPSRTSASSTTMRAGSTSAAPTRAGTSAGGGKKFCGECGTRFDTDRQKFCGECGQPRT